MIARILHGDQLDHLAESLDGSVAALATILASIPLGFLTYQFYYLSFQPFVGFNSESAKRLPRITKRWPRVDRGARVLPTFEVAELEAISSLFGVAAASKAEDKDLPPDERRTNAQLAPIDAELTAPSARPACWSASECSG